MCEFKAMSKIEDDIKDYISEEMGDVGYELQMSIDQLIMDAVEEARSRVIEAIKHNYGEEMAKAFDETCDLDNEIDQYIRDEVHL